jgi:hypothetical protein
LAGKLVDHLIRAGHVRHGACGWPDDDARVAGYDIESGVVFITNPPRLVNARAILDVLTGYGAAVVVDGHQIKLIEPIGKGLPTDLIDAARAHKDELRVLAGKLSAAGNGLEPAFYDKVTGTLLSEGSPSVVSPSSMTSSTRRPSRSARRPVRHVG